jgi:serine kinase of HPr protein (carbohydrate metabolism regulator)
MTLSLSPSGQAPRNHHASVVIAGDRGIMLRGHSGAGKSALALALLDWCKAANRFGRLVSDDQVLLSRSGQRILAEAPCAIEGLMEVRGFGAVKIPFENRAILDLVVDIVDATHAPRFQPDETIYLLGIGLPYLAINPAMRPPLAVHAVLARLEESRRGASEGGK